MKREREFKDATAAEIRDKCNAQKKKRKMTGTNLTPNATTVPIDQQMLNESKDYTATYPFDGDHNGDTLAADNMNSIKKTIQKMSEELTIDQSMLPPPAKPSVSPSQQGWVGDWREVIDQMDKQYQFYCEKSDVFDEDLRVCSVVQPEGATVQANEMDNVVHVQHDNNPADTANAKGEKKVKENHQHHHPQENDTRCEGAAAVELTDKDNSESGKESRVAHEVFVMGAEDPDDDDNDEGQLLHHDPLQALPANHPHRPSLEATIKKLQKPLNQQLNKKDSDDKTPGDHIIQDFLAEKTLLQLIRRDVQLRMQKVNAKTVRSFAVRKGFRTLPKYEDDLDELTNLKYWTRIISKAGDADDDDDANDKNKEEQEKPSMKEALKRCHEMNNVDFAARIERRYTHGTTTRLSCT